MFNHNLTLNDFVCSVATCQPEADFRSLLNIFHQTKSDFLAIPGEKLNTWRTISSKNILAFLAESGQQISVGMVNGDRGITHQEYNCTTVQDLKYLTKPALVYRADTKVTEFIKNLDDSWHTDELKHLIINGVGGLCGQLDTNKLLKYLASKFAPSPHFDLPMLSDDVINLIDSIPFPVGIEALSEKDGYYNQCWQESVDRSKDRDKSPLDVSIANWWLEKQLKELQQYQTNSTLPEHYAISNDLDDRYNKCQLDVKNSEAEPTLLLDYFARSCLKNINIDSNLEDRSLIRFEKGTEWNYLKIFVIVGTAKYWLVLAIQSSATDKIEGETPNFKATVDGLLATVSHELKSPLTGIVGLSSLLKAQKIGTLNQRQNNYVQLIHSSGQKLMSIVYDLLELTKLTAKKQPPEEIDLISLCSKLEQQIVVKLKSTAKVKPIVQTSLLEFEIEPGSVAIADKLSLSSILSHLISETIEFSGLENKIKIEVKSLARATVIIIGSKSEVDMTLTNKETAPNQSSGLNLIIAKYIAEVIGGNIDSIYDHKNCQFTLTLPQTTLQLDAATDSNSVSTTRQENPSKNLTILCLSPESELIDSNINSNNNLDFNFKNWAEQNWFDSNGQQSDHRYRIIEADGLEQAHTLARIWQLDVIVLNGYQIVNPDDYLRSLSESEYLSAIPLITLDTKTTEAANQIESLEVYPCLLPIECRSIKNLMQVIQIATAPIAIA